MSLLYSIIVFDDNSTLKLLFFDIPLRGCGKCDKTETTSTRVEFDDVLLRDPLRTPQ